ncbi:MAG: HAMP domain-containing histidine kinase [Chloroflexi bacterium]|nr:HAMP domain-containing histidine kinase [Chloroflexota bacterium]
MSLRLRLILTMLTLVLVGLAAAGTTTYFAVRSFLIDRVDSQLDSTLGPAAVELGRPRPGDGPGGGPLASLPPGTYVDLRDESGQRLTFRLYGLGDQTYPEPSLPAALIPPVDSAGNPTDRRFDAGSGGSSGLRYRVLVTPLHGGGALVVAIPMSDVEQTLRRLLVIEALVSGAVLLVTGLAGLVLIHAGLRPLRQITGAADSIAGGDLARRVPVANARTEAGRLGTALNRMLGRIEDAFRAREESEERLRRFVSDASHELRTPLTSIRGYAELFGRGASTRPADLERVMARISDQSERMSVLVEELLTLARLDEGREPVRAPVDLALVVREAIEDSRVVDAGRTVSLEAPGSVTVIGDEHQLRQVLTNVLANARQHTPEGTPVHVSLSVEASSAVLTVRDEGAGLAPTDVGHVFDRFYRADTSRSRAHGGSGLGLSIVAAIVERHGGSVTAANAPQGGAEFTIRLPLADAAAAPPRPEPATTTA